MFSFFYWSRLKVVVSVVGAVEICKKDVKGAAAIMLEDGTMNSTQNVGHHHIRESQTKMRNSLNNIAHLIGEAFRFQNIAGLRQTFEEKARPAPPGPPREPAPKRFAPTRGVKRIRLATPPPPTPPPLASPQQFNGLSAGTLTYGWNRLQGVIVAPPEGSYHAASLPVVLILHGSGGFDKKRGRNTVRFRWASSTYH